MAEKIRKFMRSERGRAFVNAMFILATMVRGSGMMFMADIFWVLWREKVFPTTRSTVR